MYESGGGGGDDEEQSINIQRLLSTPEAQLAAYKSIDPGMGPVGRRAFQTFVFNKENIDTAYGLRNKNGIWMLGDKQFYITNDDIIMLTDLGADPEDTGTKVSYFKATPELLNLIMFKNPDSGARTRDAMSAYKKILHLTSAHKRNFKRSNQMKGNPGVKWTSLIAPLMVDEDVDSQKKKKKSKSATRPKKASTTVGDGIKASMTVNNREVDYVPWRDPNILVDRLELLMGENDAGHTGVQNEIVEIVEELRTAGLIT